MALYPLDEADESFGQIGTARYNSMPSLIALQQMKNRLNAACVGKKLMRWKATAAQKELVHFSSRMCDITEPLFTKAFPDAFIELGRLNYLSEPKLSNIIFNNLPDVAHIKVITDLEFMSGSKLIKHKLITVGSAPYPLLALSRGGEQLEVVRTVFRDLLENIVEYTQLRHAFMTMHVTYMDAMKKKNVLGKLIIPKTINTIMYILGELEELEREDFFRLKKVQKMKVMKKANQDRAAFQTRTEENLKMKEIRDEVKSENYEIQTSENKLEENNVLMCINKVSTQPAKEGIEIKENYRIIASRNSESDILKTKLAEKSLPSKFNERFGSGSYKRDEDGNDLHKSLVTVIVDDIASGGLFYRSCAYISSFLSLHSLREGIGSQLPNISNLVTKTSEPIMSNRNPIPMEEANNSRRIINPKTINYDRSFLDIK